MQRFSPSTSSSTLGLLPFQPGNNPVFNFEIHTLQWFKENSGTNKLSNFEFFWVKNGDGLLMIDLERFAICEKTVYVLSPGQVRCLEPGSNMNGYYISISPDFFYAVEAVADFLFLSSGYEAVKKTVIFQVDDNNQQEPEDLLIKMRKELAHYSSVSPEILKGLFRLFLLYLSKEFIIKELPVENRRDKCLVKKFTELLCGHFKTKKMVTEYASELCVTPSYLNQVVKKVSGFTASYHIQQCLILEAKRQVIHSGSSMKEIAYNLGFDDTAHFSKFFKNNSGINFTSFKKHILQRHNRISPSRLQTIQN